MVMKPNTRRQDEGIKVLLARTFIQGTGRHRELMTPHSFLLKLLPQRASSKEYADLTISGIGSDPRETLTQPPQFIRDTQTMKPCDAVTVCYKVTLAGISCAQTKARAD